MHQTLSKYEHEQVEQAQDGAVWRLGQTDIVLHGCTLKQQKSLEIVPSKALM